MEKSSNNDIVPFAILISLIYEDEDTELTNIANEIISRNAKLQTSQEKLLRPNEYTVKAIKLKEPFHIPGLKEGRVEGKDIMVRFQLNDIKILDIGNFTTRKEKKCCLNLEFEYVKISGIYTISGIVNEKEFSGSGNANITLRNISSEAKIDHTLLDDEEENKIKNLNFDFNFRFLEFEQTGLYIKDIPNSEVRRILNSVGRVYFKQNMKVLSHKLSEKIKDRFNYILKGKSKNEILELLQRGNVKF